MKVIIIGGGLAGLTAAIAMRRGGHAVQVIITTLTLVHATE